MSVAFVSAVDGFDRSTLSQYHLTMVDVSERTEAWDKFRREMLGVIGHKGIGAGKIVPSASLPEDLGMESIEFVDLTIALEVAFGIARFPMQEWIDIESRKVEERFAAGSLFEFLLEVLHEKGQ